MHPSSSSPASRPRGLQIQINDQDWTIDGRDALSIGRDPASAIPLDDTRVSRHHAILRRVDDGWRFEDLGSSNGSFLDAEPVMALHIDEPVELRLGDPHFGPRLTLTPILATEATPTSSPTSRQPDAVNAALDPDDRPTIASSGFLIDTAPSPTVQIHQPTPNGARSGTEPPVPDEAGLTAPELDGEQLFREAVRPTPPPRPPSLAPTPDGGPELTDGDEPTPDIGRLARIFGLIVLAIGILALVTTQESFSLVLIVGGAILAFYIGSPNRLKRDQIVDRWDCLIAGAQGRGDEVLAAVTVHINRQALPFVEHEERDLAASLFRGGTRTFLVIWQDGNGRLKPYRMHVNVRDYGTNLQASWFLTYHRSFFERLKPNPLVALNLFDEQDLRAYVTAVHHGFLDAVIDLMLALGQDTSKLDRKTNGFLGIS